MTCPGGVWCCASILDGVDRVIFYDRLQVFGMSCLRCRRWMYSCPLSPWLHQVRTGKGVMGWVWFVRVRGRQGGTTVKGRIRFNGELQ